jgi:transposase
MYMRENRSGGHTYVSLAHNERDERDGVSRARILYNFGRKDRLDLDAVRRLIASLSRYLPSDEVVLPREAGSGEPLELLAMKRLGPALVLDGVWRALGLDGAFDRLLEERSFRTPVERAVFAMVAQRAIDPGSKLSVESWVADEVFIPELEAVDVQQLYRAMDVLLGAHDEIQAEVFWRVKNLFNLEVDLIFLDSTSTYFEIEGQDELEGDEAELDAGGEAGELGAEAGWRRRGHSKDKRPDLAQVVIAFAVTRDGIPVRCWVWPGNTVDVRMIQQVKRDLNTWKLSRTVLVMDAGFNSESNRRTLQGAGDAFIIGERMRLGAKGELHEALKRPGRYSTLPSGVRYKEVIVNPGSVAARRFVVVHNPNEAARDAHRREQTITELERRLVELGDLAGKEHSKAACELRAHPTFGRYLRQRKGGKLEIDRGKINREAKLDGKYLISTSDDYLSTEDVVLGYKQLHEIERVNRDLKHTVDVRPVYHRREDRIRSHVLLCWLSLLLIRLIETRTNQTWHQVMKIMRPLSVAYQHSEHGPVIQTNRVSSQQKSVLDALELKPPKRFLQLPTPTKAA